MASHCVLYRFRSEDFPVFRFFKTQALEFGERSERLLDRFLMNLEKRNDAKQYMKKLDEEVRVLVLGQHGSTIEIEKLVKVKVDGKKASLSMLEVLELDLRRELDFLVYPYYKRIAVQDRDLFRALQLQYGHRILSRVVLVDLNNVIHEAQDHNISRDLLQDVLLDKISMGTGSTSASITNKKGLFQCMCSKMEDLVFKGLVLLKENVDITRNLSYRLPLEFILLDSLQRESSVNISNILQNKLSLEGRCYEFVENKWATPRDKQVLSSLGTLHIELNHKLYLGQCMLCFLLLHTVERMSKSFANLLSKHLKSLQKKVTPNFEKESTLDISKPSLAEILQELSASLLTRISTFETDDKKISAHKQLMHYVSELSLKSKAGSKPERSSSPGIAIRKKSVENVNRMLTKHHDDLIFRFTDLLRNSFIKTAQEIKQPWVQQVLRLDFEMNGLFRQSHIPYYQRLGSSDLTLPKDITACLFKRIPAVRGCGYCLGKLQVHVEASYFSKHKEAITKEIQEFFFEQGIIEVEVSTILGNVKEMKYATGEEVRSVHHGTLGGFAEMKPCNSHRPTKLCALVSDHIVCGADHISLVIDRENDVSVEIGKKVPIDATENKFDIASFEIHRRLRPKFETRLRNRAGTFKSCKVIENKEDLVRLEGSKVHIWGAKSKPGVGIIASGCYEFRVEEQPSVPQTYVLIADDVGNETNGPFCTEGDSGSIICSDAPSDEHINVLSMLIGQCQRMKIEGLYLTFILKEGLEDLGRRAGTLFKLCNEI